MRVEVQLDLVDLLARGASGQVPSSLQMQESQHNSNRHSKAQLLPQRAHRPLDHLPSRNPHTPAAHTNGSHQQRPFPAGPSALNIRKDRFNASGCRPTTARANSTSSPSLKACTPSCFTVDSGRVVVGSAQDRPPGATGSAGDLIASISPGLARCSPTTSPGGPRRASARRTRSSGGLATNFWTSSALRAHSGHSESGGNALTFQDQLSRPTKRRPGGGPLGHRGSRRGL